MSTDEPSKDGNSAQIPGEVNVYPRTLPDPHPEETVILTPIFSIEATDQAIGDRLRAVRLSQGMSQETLAKKMGHQTTSQVRRLERAESSPNMASVRRAMEALNIKVL